MNYVTWRITSLILRYISGFAVNNDHAIFRVMSEKSYHHKHLRCRNLWKLQRYIVFHTSVVNTERPMSRFSMNQWLCKIPLISAKTWKCVPWKNTSCTWKFRKQNSPVLSIIWIFPCLVGCGTFRVPKSLRVGEAERFQRFLPHFSGSRDTERVTLAILSFRNTKMAWLFDARNYQCQ